MRQTAAGMVAVTEFPLLVPRLPVTAQPIYTAVTKIINNNNTNNSMTIFMVLSPWHSAIARVHPVHLMNAD